MENNLEINDTQERSLTATSLINYLTNRMDNIANMSEIINSKQEPRNEFMDEQVKVIRDWLNAVDMQLSKIVNELVDICDSMDLIDECETFILPQLEYINSKKHEEL